MTASSSSSSTSSVHHLFTFAPSSLSRISKSRRHQDNKHTMALCHQHQTMAPQKRSNNKQVQTDFTATSPTTMTTTSTTTTTEWTFESVNFKVCQKNGVAKVTAAASSPLLFNNSQQQRYQMTCNNNTSNNNSNNSSGFGQFQYGSGSRQAKRVTTQHHPLQELEEEELELEMTTTGGGGGEQEGGPQESNILRIQQRKIHATGFASHWVLQTAGSSSSSSSSSPSQHKSKQQTRRKAATVTATTTENSKSGMKQTGGDEQQRLQQNSGQQWQHEPQNQEEQQRQPLKQHHNRWAEEQREIIDAMYSILEAHRHKQQWGSDPDIIGSGDSHRWLEEQNSTAHALNSQNGTNRPLRIRDMLN